MGLVRPICGSASAALGWPWPGLADGIARRGTAAALEVISCSGITHSNPGFNITSVSVRGRDYAVHEEIVAKTPFCTLLRFSRDGLDAPPRVLMAAPLSGHFATLLRATAHTMVQDHDVYVTDWHNARDVKLTDGQFGFSEYVHHLMDFLRVMGPGAHLMAVCQPAVPALAAAAIMAEDDDPAQPRSLVLMAGPIDTRISPTVVNKLAMEHPISWFESNLIATVPYRYPGHGRKVYPGFMQLTAFMSMNLDKHVRSFANLFDHRVAGEQEKADGIRTFYEEYLAVLDLPAEFYLETVEQVFQKHALPLGTLMVGDRRVDCSALRKTTLLTVEGERDDICAIGQTLAAHDLCTNLRPARKRHHVQTGVGHYGVFAGRRWNDEIYPLARDVIHLSN